eukprot:scaffold4824_cov69-Phaeocystis_antarctica.AAC.2
MLRMVVTLDVSRLSGWLNDDAPCRVERRAYDAGRGAGRDARGRGVGGGASGMHWGPEGLTQGWGPRARAERTENMPYMVVTLDVSKVSGWLNADAYCRVERRAYDAGRGAGRDARGRGAEGGRKWHALGPRGPDSRLGAQGMRGAHREHAVHGCDAGRVEAQRLVEGPRVLPSRKEGMRCRARCGPERKAWGGGDVSGVHGEGPTQGWGPGHARSAPRTCCSWL